MRIFLTGGTGFMGRYMARALKAEGHSLCCLARRSSNIQELENLGVEIAFGDVLEPRSMAPGMAGCDALVHLAGLSSFWEQDRAAYSRVNTRGTRNVMECAIEAGVPRVVHMSCLNVYGKPARRPFTEESPVGPVRFSEYARTKYEGERIAWNLHARKGLPLVVLNPGIVLGPRRPESDASFIGHLLGAVAVSRSFSGSMHALVHVRDVVDAVTRVLKDPFPSGERYFLAGECLSIRSLLALIENTSGSRVGRARLPRSLVGVAGAALTTMAGVLKRPPLRGLSSDYISTLSEGMAADGGKARRNLGIVYTPISEAVSQEMRSLELKGLISDKRRARRHQLSLEIVYKAHGDDSPMSGYILNISESGMFLVTHKAYPRGRYISANLCGKRPGEYLMARGRVVRATPGGIAVDFIRPDGNVRTLIEDLRSGGSSQPPSASVSL